LDSLVRPREGETFLAHYRLQEEIGRGGMGTVYRAQDTLLDRQVAVKVLADELSADSELRDRFVREARLIARMAHPNLPQIHFVGRSEGRLFFAMEWIDGESLEARLRRGPVPVASALEMIRQVAIGLQAAHRAGIVHRDIKPSNVMVTRDGVVKILDFGIARSVAFDAGATATGTFLGTPHYVSPEQARGETVDHRSDIHSTGQVLFALLTGKSPFEGTNPLAVLTDRLLKPVPEIPPEIACGEEVRKLVRRMMAKDPADRHPSCEELRHEIEEAAPGELVPANVERRQWAGALDLLLIGLPIVASWAVFQAITGYFPTTLLYDSGPGRALLGLILLVWPTAYSALLTDREGRSVGQRMEGVRTATREDDAPTRGRRTVRALTIWAPVALGMSIQTDWPPAARDANVPWLLVRIWVIALLLMPYLHPRRWHVADILSRTQVLEIRRRWRGASAGTTPRAKFVQALTDRRALARVPGFLCVALFAVLVWRQLSGFPGALMDPGPLQVRETVLPGRPGWDRLLDRFRDEYLGPKAMFENPEALSLHRGLFYDHILAGTLPSDTLRIVNRLYGSRKLLTARGMTADGPSFFSGPYGVNRTEEVPPSSPEEEAEWEAARRKAYRGSTVHFMRSLMHGRLREEGFEVLTPDNFRGLFRREDGFLLVAWPGLRVRVAGDSDVKDTRFYQGSLRVTPWGRWGGYLSSGGMRDAGSVPTSVLIRYAAEQDSLWGRRTESIDRVLSLE
jgi:predicted Ser/Thr protein kinase